MFCFSLIGGGCKGELREGGEGYCRAFIETLHSGQNPLSVMKLSTSIKKKHSYVHNFHCCLISDGNTFECVIRSEPGFYKRSWYGPGIVEDDLNVEKGVSVGVIPSKIIYRKCCIVRHVLRL